MNPWNEPRIGIIGLLLLIGFCSIPGLLLGLGDTAAFLSGVAVAAVVLAAIDGMRRCERIEEMREATRDFGRR